jgi:NIMA-interacting peptidyl-prolyl cis-trans isomerase 1
MLFGAGCAAAADSAAAPPTKPYPPGLYRLAPSEDLARVKLWVSHILIRHDAAAPRVVSFELGEWTPARPSSRTRAEAFELAQRIAEQVRARPADFAAIARSVSEDLKSQSLGGSLGGICAAEFRVHTQVLDVLAALSPGEVSRVVETPYGFHIFQRRPPPPSETVSGARIVIGYDEAPWLASFLARRPVPARTRAQALALADEIDARARKGESFDALVAEYSDHEEALRNGDFGEWSTTGECSGPLAREIEVLQQLQVGEVARPLDSPFGVEIIKRTANRPRQSFAMTTLQQLFATAMNPGQPARKTVLAEMERLAEEIRTDPARFEPLQAKYCCAGQVETWPEGRGTASMEQALVALKIGQISAGVVEAPYMVAIVKRLEPRMPPAPKMVFDLPAPHGPDLRYLASQGVVNAQLPALATEARERLTFKAGVAERFVRLHEAQSEAPEAQTDAERVRAFDAFLGQVRELLGPENYDDYLGVMNEHYKKYILAQPLLF